MSNFCGSCGTPRSTPDQRFCSGCGNALTAPASPAVPPVPPVPPVPTGPVTHAPPPYVPAPVGAPVDYAVPQQLPPIGTGRRAPVGKIVGIGALVLALAGAGVVAWAVLKPRGGAESPEAAVEQFLEAVVAQDPVGALELVNPGEVDGMDEVYEAAYERLEDEGLVDGEGISDAVDIELDDLAFDVRELGDSAARVVLTSGDYRVSFDPAELPDRLSFVADAYPDGDAYSGDLVEDLRYDLPDLNRENDRPEPFVTTVKVDGGWYISAFGTFVDAFFSDTINLDFDGYDVREPDYDAIAASPDPIVASDPEEVFDNLVDAVNDGDPAELLANLPDDQVVALRPYAQTLEDALAEQAVQFEVAVSDLELETEDVGDGLLKVTVDRALLSGTVYDEGDVESGTLQVDGRCFVASSEYDYEDECIDGELVDDTGIDSVFLMLREVDDGYQLDPLATAAAYARTVVDSVPSSFVDRALLGIQSELTDECDYVEDGFLVSCE